MLSKENFVIFDDYNNTRKLRILLGHGIKTLVSLLTGICFYLKSVV